MIVLITGLPGHGKGLFSLSHIKAKADKEGRPVYYHGVTDLALDWIKLENPEKWYECPHGAIILIDEAQKTFRPRSSGSPVPVHVSNLETHRHNGHDLFIVTQHPALLDVNLRKLVDKHYHLVRKFGTESAVLHEFTGLNPDPQKSRKDSIRHSFKYPKDVYNWYKSAEVHTVKANRPLRYYMLFLIPVIAILAIAYTVYVLASDFTDKPEPKNNTEVQQKSQPPVPVYLPPPTQSTEQLERTYVQDYTPELNDFPHTAPAYKQVIQPQSAPYPSACVDYKGVCRCWSQQSTEMQISRNTCLQVAQHGFFRPWLPDNRPVQVASNLQPQTSTKAP